MNPGVWFARAKTAVVLAVGLVVYAGTHLVPRRDSLWVFGADGGQRFSGNPKYQFLHAAEERDDVRAVWLSTDDGVVDALNEAGFEAYHRDGRRGRYATARAGRLFVSHDLGDVAKWWTGGAEVVQLWHGVPLKKIGRDVDRGWSRLTEFFFGLFSDCDHLVVTSRNQADVFAGAFPVDRADVTALGYPRNDALLREFPGEDDVGDHSLDEVESLARDGPLVAYVPTWRRGFSERHGRPLATTDLDFADVNRVLARHDAHLLLKLHPSAEADVDVAAHDRIVDCPADADMNALLRHVDVLITDYSSVYFDYLYLDRPVLFFAYDRESYADRPGFYFDYDEVTPGPVAESGDDLLDALDATLGGEDGYAAERERVRSRFFDSVDARSAERVAREVTE